MSPRPGRISEIVKIDLPRPRTLDMQFTQKFKGYSDRVRAVIDQGQEKQHKKKGGRVTDKSLSLVDDAIEHEVINDRRSWLKESLAPLLTFATLVALWEFAADYFGIPAWLLPSPSTIAVAFVEWRGELWNHSLTTLYETIVGFALSIGLAVPLAVAVVYSPFLRKCIYPICCVTISAQSCDCSAAGALDRLWRIAEIIVVFLVCFFPIIVATATGLASVPGPVMDLIRSLSANQLQTFIKFAFRQRCRTSSWA